MRVTWGNFSQTTGAWLKTSWLITAGLVALYFGAVKPLSGFRTVATEHNAAWGAVAQPAWEPISLWQESKLSRVARVAKQGIVGGVPGGVERGKLMAYLQPAAFDQGGSADRKLVRTCALTLVAKSPAETADKIRTLAESAGGFLASSETSGAQNSASASLSIRVPVAKFEEVRAAIRQLGLRVESEKLDAQDVTRQYVDQEARLRNLRAEETQYLAILKRAATVKDTLEVTEKLSEVRGEIEQQQAEFNALSKQVETVVIAISLYAEADVRVFGLNWRPLYQLKMSAREGVLAVGDYAASMTAFVFYLPAVLLWLATILAGAAIGWRLLKWVARVFFAFPKPRIEPELTAQS